MSADAPSPLRNFFVNLFSGTCAGVGICLVGHPFGMCPAARMCLRHSLSPTVGKVVSPRLRLPADTVKVLLQTQDHNNPVYSGAMDATRKIIKAEGLTGLYKGVASPLAGVAPLLSHPVGVIATLFLLRSDACVARFSAGIISAFHGCVPRRTATLAHRHASACMIVCSQ